ncbi:replication initiation and membrane attachment protein [Lactobacillus colini]|uniref:Replication initiation and membrane attachment protein n=1 Tax=Lactobacillus colini TaxID=1819254 RepID=A0ABS4MGG4_9LACO|nr:DnaD domain protein [Lactobacillus colini]MBP2058792.1 replication initiation and membrane attachment protein [Lactobacillus colini]
MFASTDPREPFYVANKVELDDEKERVLTRLYQPLVGILGVGLYITLMSEFDSVPLAGDYKTLYQLQDQTDSSLKDIFDAIHKLEATGLVKTYVGNNPILGEVIIFEILPIPAAQEFFKTFLLSSLLLEKVGSYAYQRLVDDFTPRKFRGLENAQEVTSGFFDVFHLNKEKAIEPEQEVKAASQKVGDSPKKGINIGHNVAEIDWQFLIDSFELYHIDKKEITLHKNEISQIINFYDLSELEFVNVTLPTLSSASNKLDIRAIQLAANENYGSRTNSKIISNQIKQANEDKVKNNVAEPNLSEKEKELEKNMATLKPVDFLQDLKKAKRQFATSAERVAAFKIENNYGISMELANAVIYGCLQSNLSLYLRSAERIINDWASHEITTAAEAIVYMRKRKQAKQERQERSYTPKRYYQPKPPRPVQGVDWDNYHPESEKEGPVLSKEEMNEIFRKYGKNND